MNLRPYKVILWKETRTLGGLWLASIALAMVISAAYLSESRDPKLWYYFISLIAAVPAFYAAGCAATMFAGEKEARTHLFLGSLPVAPGQLFRAKLLFTAASTLLLAGMLAAVSYLAILWLSPQRTAEIPTTSAVVTLWCMWLLVAILGLSSGLLASVLTSRPMVAVCIGIAIASTIIHLLTDEMSEPLLLARRVPLFGLALYTIGPAVLMSAVAYRKAQPWFYEATAGNLRLPLPRFEFGISRRLWPVLVRSVRAMWLAWRESRAQMLVMLAIFAGIVTWLSIMFPKDNSHWRLLLAKELAIGSAFFGAAVLQGKFSFLAQRGVSPVLFWATRQCAWLLVAFAGAVPLMFYHWPHGHTLATWMNDPWFPEPGPRIWVAADWWVTMTIGGFAVGQLSSLLIRNTLVATVVGMGLAWPLVTWCTMMADVRLPFSLTVLPVAVGLFALSLAGTRWLLDERLSRGQAAVIVILALVIGALQVFTVREGRIHGVENIAADSIISEPPRASAANVRSAKLYREANLGLTDVPADRDLEQSNRLYTLTPEREGWVAEHEAELKLAIQASQGDVADFEFKPDADTTILSWLRIQSLFDLSGQLRERSGDLVGALDCYWGLLHFAASAQYHRAMDNSTFNDRLEHGLKRLMHWAAAEEQTGENLTRAARLLEKLPAMYDTPAQSIGLKYQEILNYLEQGSNGDDSPITFDNWFGKAVGEPDRARRILNALAFDDLAGARMFTEWVGAGKPLHSTALLYEPSLAADTLPLTDSTPSIRYLYFRPPFVRVAQRETWLRAASLVIALHRWRVDYGELPRTLDQLVPEYLGAVPIDPYSGEPLRYFPKGLQIDSPFNSKSEPDAGRATDWNQPFVWSMNLYVLRPNKGQAAAEPYIVATPKWYNELRRYVLSGRSATEYEALVHGTVFPLDPTAED